jgi:hypothetical protein
VKPLLHCKCVLIRKRGGLSSEEQFINILPYHCIWIREVASLQRDNVLIFYHITASE